MKSLFKSRTFWFNVIVGVTSIVAGGQAPIPVIGDIIQSTGIAGLVQQHPAVVGGVTAAVNVALRTITTQPVTVLSKE